LNYLNQRKEIQREEKETRQSSDPHLNRFKKNKIQKITTATTLSKFRRRRGYHRTMKQPCLTSDHSRITTLRVIATIIFILLGFIALPDVHCNYHCTNMPKVSKPKDRSSKASQQTSQQSLCPRGNSHSPMENNTNTYIANINLNRGRSNNVLTSLGGLPSSTQYNAPPDSSDGTGDPSLPSGKPPADPDLDSAGTPVDTGAVRIDESPTHNHPPTPTAPTMVHPTQVDRQHSPVTAK
jgi:hypothetical protein